LTQGEKKQKNSVPYPPKSIKGEYSTTVGGELFYFSTLVRGKHQSTADASSTCGFLQVMRARNLLDLGGMSQEQTLPAYNITIQVCPSSHNEKQ
jgi:hypothetical protein